MNERFSLYIGFVFLCIALEYARRAWIGFQNRRACHKVEQYFEEHGDCVVTTELVCQCVSMNPRYVHFGICTLVKEGKVCAQISGCPEKIVVMNAAEDFEQEDVSEFSYSLNR